MKIKGLGVDVVEVKRFARFKNDQKNKFLTGNFSPSELQYCFSFKDPSEHLAGTFSAKEAVFKSIGQKIAQSQIEICRNKYGKPEVKLNGKKLKNVFVSISHTDKLATAIAITQQ